MNNKNEILIMLSETYNLIHNISVKGDDVIRLAHAQAKLQTVIQDLGEELNIDIEFSNNNDVESGVN